MSTLQEVSPEPQGRSGGALLPSILALVFALIGTCGSLALSVGLGLKACPLCFYQRSFVMAVLSVLAVGLCVDRSHARLYGLLALPLSVAGLGVAAFHEYLVLSDVLECPRGVFGVGTVPAQSLAIFVLLSLLLVLSALTPRDGQRPLLKPVMGATVLGLLLAWGSVASSPPLPPAPAAPYDPVEQPLDMCRPPYPGEADTGVG